MHNLFPRRGPFRGQSLLQEYFGDEGISPAKLFHAAAVPTIVMGLAFMVLP